MRACASRAICEAVTEHDAYRASEEILCYVATRSEVDLAFLYARARADGKRLLFVRTRGRDLEFCPAEGPETFVEGDFGIPCPPPECAPQELFTKALCIVPALSADRNGNRLGYGGGFYDRFLARHPELVTLCVVYEDLLSEHLCREEFDVVMQHVFTEKGERTSREA